MTNYGSTVAGGGFLPSAPDAEDVLANILKGGEGYSSIFKTPAAVALSDQQQKAQDLKKSYAQFAATPLGRIIIEDLLDQTLRRGTSHPDKNASIEQEALYSRERNGQNAMIIYILSMIEAGRNVPSQTAKKSRKKK